MSTIREPRNGQVFDQLAGRLRQMVRDVHHNELSGVDRFTVLTVSPFVVAEVHGDLTLEDGDPDFSIGETLRTRITASQVNAGDLIWVGRNGGAWHAFDVVSR
jgi:DNA helicase TIP49 (TBP-interacting protein)